MKKTNFIPKTHMWSGEKNKKCKIKYNTLEKNLCIKKFKIDFQLVQLVEFQFQNFQAVIILMNNKWKIHILSRQN